MWVGKQKEGGPQGTPKNRKGRLAGTSSGTIDRNTCGPMGKGPIPRKNGVTNSWPAVEGGQGEKQARCQKSPMAGRGEVPPHPSQWKKKNPERGGRTGKEKKNTLGGRLGQHHSFKLRDINRGNTNQRHDKKKDLQDRIFVSKH